MTVPDSFDLHHNRKNRGSNHQRHLLRGAGRYHRNNDIFAPLQNSYNNVNSTQCKALLIGCTYIGSKSPFQLNGPSNDVYALQEILIKLWKVPKENIILLTDAHPGYEYDDYYFVKAKERKSKLLGSLERPTCPPYLPPREKKINRTLVQEVLHGDDKEGNSFLLPTKSNIEYSIEKLMSDVKDGDLRLVLFSGISTQIEDLNSCLSNGFLEAFLPSDFADDPNHNFISCAQIKNLLTLRSTINVNCQVLTFFDTCGCQTAMDPTGVITTKNKNKNYSIQHFFPEIMDNVLHDKVGLPEILKPGTKWHIKGAITEGLTWPLINVKDTVRMAKYDITPLQHEKMKSRMARPRYQPLIQIKRLEKPRIYDQGELLFTNNNMKSFVITAGELDDLVCECRLPKITFIQEGAVDQDDDDCEQHCQRLSPSSNNCKLSFDNNLQPSHGIFSWSLGCALAHASNRSRPTELSEFFDDIKQTVKLVYARIFPEMKHTYPIPQLTTLSANKHSIYHKLRIPGTKCTNQQLIQTVKHKTTHIKESNINTSFQKGNNTQEMNGI